MYKNNIKYPQCDLKKLYKFEFDKQSNPKYECKKCNRAKYVHYKYKHYNEYIRDIRGNKSVLMHFINITI